MTKTKNTPPATRASALQRVLDMIASRPCSWYELRDATSLTDDGFGRVLVDLFAERKIWTDHQGEVRIYGLVRGHTAKV